MSFASSAPCAVVKSFPTMPGIGVFMSSLKGRWPAVVTKLPCLTASWYAPAGCGSDGSDLLGRIAVGFWTTVPLAYRTFSVSSYVVLIATPLLSAAAALLGPAPERPRFSAGPDDALAPPLLQALAPPARPRFFLGGLAAGLGPMSAGGKPSSMVIVADTDA